MSRPLHSANDRAETVEHGAICLHLGEVHQEFRASLGDSASTTDPVTLTKDRPELTDVISAGVSKDGADELASILLAATMALSSVTILTNALRLRRVKVS